MKATNVIILGPTPSWEKRLYNFEVGKPLVVLRPYGNSPTDPADATVDNSLVTVYLSAEIVETYAPPLSLSRRVRMEQLPCRNHAGSFFQNATGEWTAESGGWSAPGRFLGDVLVTGGEGTGFGYYDHILTRHASTDPSSSSYFNCATYNPVNGTYTINTNLTAGDGPDWRISTLYTVYDWWGSWGFPDESADCLLARWADGEELYDPIDLGAGVPKFIVNQSRRDSEVYHAGSLVLREESVFTNATDYVAQFDVLRKWVYHNDSLGHPTNIVWVDVRTGVSRVVYSADYRGTNSFDGDLKLSETDEAGVKTLYTYDSLKRLVSQSKEGIAASGGFPAQSAMTASYAYDASHKVIGETNAAGSLSLFRTNVFDLAGRLQCQRETNGLVTTLAYELGGRRVTTTLPSGATEIRENQLDGRIKSVTGTAVVHQFHQWDYVGGSQDPYLQYLGMRDTIRLGSEQSSRVVEQVYDWPGRLVLTRKPDCQSTNLLTEYLNYYGERPGLLFTIHKTTGFSTDPMERMVIQMFNYDLVGTSTNAVLEYHGYAPGPFPDLSNILWGEYGPERLSRSAHRYTKLGQDWYRCTTNMVFRSYYDSTPTIAGVSLERLNGFSSGNTLSEVQSWDADTNLTTVTVTVDRNAKKITQVTVTSSLQSDYNTTNIVVNGLLQSESTHTVGVPSRHYYDALARETQVVSPLGFSATVTYNQAGQRASFSDFTGSTTAYEYYGSGEQGAGQVKCLTQAGKKTYFSYTLRGEQHRSWGRVPYPEERVYSDYGDLTQLRTFRGGSGWESGSWPTATTGTADTTTWAYDGPSGLLVSKTDAQNRAVSYSYNGGLIQTRAWARLIGSDPVTLTNTYNGYGEIVRMDYSDGTPAVEFNEFNRRGLPESIVDGAGTLDLDYDHANRLTTAAYSAGVLAGITVSNHFDSVYGRDGLSVLGADTELHHGYSYDSYGRLSTVENGAFWAAYGYLPNSDLLQTTTCRSNSTPILTTTRSWEYGMRLGAILNEVNGVNVSSHRYTYDALNRRTAALLEDGSQWRYAYNDRNELIGAQRFWSDWAPVAGQQFGYDYDNIGNRKSARAGGDSNGLNLRTTGYEVNSLNQYTAITNLGYVDILGVALATDSVSVNGALAERKGEYFRKELGIGNGSGPLWTNVTVVSATITNGGGLIVPDDRQTLVYDLDGNLAFDGTWSYEWDGENRLTAMTMTDVASIEKTNRLRLEFAYDYQGRRVQKVVSTNSTGSVFVPQSTNRFVYDGWNLLAVVTSDLGLLTSFTWGNDLSGTMEEAGGIGGLLLVTTHGSPGTKAFVAYDGNGNVTALVKGGSDPIAARYEYSPFGQLIRATGPMATANPFRWSTKFWDEESGLVYYGYRYYDPWFGRWLGKDPSEERGSLNLYEAMLNSPPMQVDPNGLWTFGIGLQGAFELVGALGFEVGGYVGKNPATGKWSFGFIFGPKAGAGGPFFFGGSLFTQYTTADSVNDLKGFSNEIGCSVGGDATPSMGVDGVLGIGAGGVKYLGIQGSIGYGLSFLVEVHNFIAWSVGYDSEEGWGG